MLSQQENKDDIGVIELRRKIADKEEIKQVVYLSHFHPKISKCKVHLTNNKIDDAIDIFDRESYKKLSDYKIEAPYPICSSNIAGYSIPIDITKKKNIKDSLKCQKCFKQIYEKKKNVS